MKIISTPKMSGASKNGRPVNTVNSRNFTVGKVVQSLSFQGNNKGVRATRWAAVALSNSCSFAATSGSISSLSTHPYMHTAERLRRHTGCRSVCVCVRSLFVCFLIWSMTTYVLFHPPGQPDVTFTVQEVQRFISGRRFRFYCSPLRPEWKI